MKISVPATTANLGPGFDCLGATLDLENELEADFNDRYLLEEEGYSDGVTFEGHLIAGVIKNFLKDQGIEKPFRLKTVNRIPFARGLGSSSAAIVGALVLANRLSGKSETERDLLKRAIKIEGHPDNVAPALLGGIILTVQDRFIRLPSPQVASFVLIPEFRISTKDARDVLPNQINRQEAVRNSSLLSRLVLGLERGDGDLFLGALDDKIHEPYRGKLIPGFFALRDSAMKLGGRLIISGSGPTLLYLQNSSIKEAERNAKRLSAMWLENFGLKNRIRAVSLGLNTVKVLDC